MSTIKVDNIRIASESVSRPVTGVAAAWCHFDTKTDPITERDSLNMAVLTDHGPGETTLGYTNDMASINYPLCTSSSGVNTYEVNSAHTASTCKIFTTNAADNVADTTSVSVVIHGDLA